MNTKIVCICGSTRFKTSLTIANKLETLDGNIVLTVGFFGHCEAVAPTAKQKKLLDRLHRRKIDLAEEVFVVSENGYIGDSTTSEIAYALFTGKALRWFEGEEFGEKWMIDNSHRIAGYLPRHLLEITKYQKMYPRE